VTCRRSDLLYSKSSALRPERDDAVERRAPYPPMQQILDALFLKFPFRSFSSAK
jgi:hypothetical protein